MAGEIIAHTMVDYCVGVIKSDETTITLDTKNSDWIAMYKDDVIAMAKHFNLTSDDLEN